MPKMPKNWLLIVFLVWLIGFILLVFIMDCKAENYTDEEICQAIFYAEGGYKATYLFGIRSVPYTDYKEAKKICMNTIRNNRKRYKEYGYKQYKTYLEFLSSKYCPVGCENDNGTNKYWLDNVKYFLNKGRKAL